MITSIIPRWAFNVLVTCVGVWFVCQIILILVAIAAIINAM